MKISDLIKKLHQYAPYPLQEDYDNSGLIFGHPETEINEILISLDCTEAVIDQAIATGCNVVVSHHPIVFRGIKSLSYRNYVERTLIKAIQHNIAIISYHTNLDNVPTGVNRMIAERLSLQNTRILSPKKGLLKQISFYCPSNQVEQVCKAMHKAGAGNIGHYTDCSFRITGTGTYTPDTEAKPYQGTSGVKEYAEEVKVEMICPAHSLKAVVDAMISAHPYEEVAHFVIDTENSWQDAGSGMIGSLPYALSVQDFLIHLKTRMELPVVKFTSYSGNIQKVAVCGGAGVFLLKDAIAAGADAFITSDVKYHEFFDTEGKLLMADIGHYESEKYTPELILRIIQQNLPNIAARLCKVNTNPVNYF